MTIFGVSVKSRGFAIASSCCSRYAGSNNRLENGVRAPIVEAENGQAPRRKLRQRKRGPIGRLLRRIGAVALILALLPLGLTVLYRVPAVHPISTLMLADLVRLKGYDRRWIPLEEMGQNVVYAVMMSEDGQFCSHHGIDLGEFRGVISDALSGERPRGASTIPMQAVKNLFLWSSRSYIRKLLEIPLAIYFDLVLPKDRIMEIYLNIAEWGPGIYGVEAAAQHYFGRPAKALSLRQSALLAATLPNPHARNPAQPTRGLNRIASIIEARSKRAGAYVACLKRS